MTWPPEKGGGCLPHAPVHPKPQRAQSNGKGARVQHDVCDPTPLVCSTQKFQRAEETRGSESRALLRLILCRLAEIQAQLKSPLAVRQLHLRYCAKCGERVTNENVGGYEGKSAITGRLFCCNCADEMEAP